MKRSKRRAWVVLRYREIICVAFRRRVARSLRDHHAEAFGDGGRKLWRVVRAEVRIV
ncbi:MAG TPA: hypothetical protein VNE82_03460 [Candidatus Binataceae bacterium]|nr:hypothetical protein [Candidatus Binataceae bacterium]